MAEYIEKETATDTMKNAQFEYTSEEAAEFISHIPAADVAPVRHGYDLLGNSLFECSLCHWRCDDTIPGGEYNYCPGCGAKMDGGDSDER